MSRRGLTRACTGLIHQRQAEDSPAAVRAGRTFITPGWVDPHGVLMPFARAAISDSSTGADYDAAVGHEPLGCNGRVRVRLLAARDRLRRIRRQARAG
jgi:hypothetical protein